MSGILETLFGGSSNNTIQPGGYSPVTVNTDPQGVISQALGSRWGQAVAANGAVPGSDSGVFSPSVMERFTGYNLKDGTKVNGWGGMALGGLSSLGNAMMAKKQYGLARDSLKENMRQYNQNFAAQRKMVNSQLEDRQRARVASNPNEYESVGSYMSRNGV